MIKKNWLAPKVKNKYILFPSNDPKSHILYQEFQFGNYFIQSDEEISLLKEEEMWSMEFDGSCSSSSLGARVVLISTKGVMSTYSFKLDFPNTNNTLEYEALLLGLHEEKLKQIKFLIVKGDVEFIVKKVQGLYDVKNDRLE